MYGGAIINGRSTQGVAIGGGICSTSTTIFNAALRAGLEMGIRLNHFYYIDRYPDGLDATVSIMDGWAQDMTFRNDTEQPDRHPRLRRQRVRHVPDLERADRAHAWSSPMR